MDTSEYETYYDDNFEEQDYDAYDPADESVPLQGVPVRQEETQQGNVFPSVKSQNYPEYDAMEPDSLDGYASHTHAYDGSVGHNVHKALGRVMEYVDQYDISADNTTQYDKSQDTVQMRLTTSKQPAFPELESIVQPEEKVTQEDIDALSGSTTGNNDDVNHKNDDISIDQEDSSIYDRNNMSINTSMNNTDNNTDTNTDNNTKTITHTHVTMKTRPLSVQEKLHLMHPDVSKKTRKNLDNNTIAKNTPIHNHHTTTNMITNRRKCLCRYSRLQAQDCGALDCISLLKGSEHRRSTMVSTKHVRQREAHQAFNDWKCARQHFTPTKPLVLSQDDIVTRIRGRPRAAPEQVAHTVSQFQENARIKDGKVKQASKSEMEQKKAASIERQRLAKRVYKEWVREKGATQGQIRQTQKQLSAAIRTPIHQELINTVKDLSVSPSPLVSSKNTKKEDINPYTLRRTLGALGVTRNVPLTLRWAPHGKATVQLGGSNKYRSPQQAKVYLESVISVKKQMALRTVLRQLRDRVLSTQRVQHQLKIVLGRQSWWRQFVILAVPEEAKKSTMEHIYKVKDDLPGGGSKSKIQRIQMQKSQTPVQTTEVSVLEQLLLCNVLAKAQQTRKESSTSVDDISQKANNTRESRIFKSKKVMLNRKQDTQPGVSSKKKPPVPSHITMSTSNTPSVNPAIVTHKKISVPKVKKIPISRPTIPEVDTMADLQALHYKLQQQMKTASSSSNNNTNNRNQRRDVLNNSTKNSPYKEHVEPLQRTNSATSIPYNNVYYTSNQNNMSPADHHHDKDNNKDNNNDTSHDDYTKNQEDLVNTYQDDNYNDNREYLHAHENDRKHTTYTDTNMLNLGLAHTPPAKTNSVDWYAGLSPQVQAIQKKHDRKDHVTSPSYNNSNTYTALHSTIPTYHSTHRVASHSAATQEQQKQRQDEKKTVLELLEDHEKQPRYMSILPDSRQAQYKYTPAATTSTSVRTTLRPQSNMNHDTTTNISIHYNEQCPQQEGSSQTYKIAYTQSLRALDGKDCCCDIDHPSSNITHTNYEYEALEKHDSIITARAQAILEKYR